MHSGFLFGFWLAVTNSNRAFHFTVAENEEFLHEDSFNIWEEYPELIRLIMGVVHLLQ